MVYLGYSLNNRANIAKDQQFTRLFAIEKKL